MKIIRLWLLGCIFNLLLYSGQAHSSEIGFSVGSYFKSSDINEPIQVAMSTSPWDDNIYIDRGTNSSDPLRGPIGVKMGERSAASYLGFIYVHNFLHPSFELEHTFGGAFGAEMSAKPHILIYSSNLNFIFPYYPKISLWHVKPFIGAGLGYVFNFGENFGLKIDKEEVPPQQYFPGMLSSNGNFQYNFGGGVKIQVWKQWWVRLSLRDYVLPSMKMLNFKPQLGRVFSTVKETTHNISFTVSLVSLDRKLSLKPID